MWKSDLKDLRNLFNMQISGSPALRNADSVGLGRGPESCSFSKCPGHFSAGSTEMALGQICSQVRITSLALITFKRAAPICLLLWWIPDKGVADKAPVWWGVTVTASSLTTSCAASHHFCSCHQTPSFPLSLPPCHHQLPLPLLPLTLQVWVRSTVELEEAHFGRQDDGVLILPSHAPPPPTHHAGDQRETCFWPRFFKKFCKPG